jgi:FtsZ-binding cell division protein ZapB
MELYKAEVRKYKKGKYDQWSIPISKGHSFEDKEEVVVGKLEDITHLEAEVEDLKKTNNQLNIEVKEVLKKLTVATDIISKQKDLISTQDKVLAIYMNRGIFSRLRNPIPKDMKMLEDNREKLIQLEDSRPLVIELPGRES